MFTYEVKRKEKKLIIYLHEIGDIIRFERAKVKYELEYEIKDSNGKVIERDIEDAEKDVGVNLEDIKRTLEDLEKDVEDRFRKNVVEYVDNLNRIEKEGIKIEYIIKRVEDP